MPIYEYQCRGCGHQFEYLVLKTSPAAKCPKCKKADLEQLISLSSVSSEGIREARLSAAHKQAAVVRHDRERSQHDHLHEHFEDKPIRKKHKH